MLQHPGSSIMLDEFSSTYEELRLWIAPCRVPQQTLAGQGTSSVEGMQLCGGEPRHGTRECSWGCRCGAGQDALTDCLPCRTGPLQLPTKACGTCEGSSSTTALRSKSGPLLALPRRSSAERRC